MTWLFRPRSTPAELSLKEIFFIGFLLAVVVFLAIWGLSELAWHFNPTFPE